MDEKQKFTVKDEKGREIECEPLFTFESDETNKNYAIYTDGSKNEKNEINLFASTYETLDNYSQFIAIESEKEWNMIKNVVKEIFNIEI